MSSPHLAPFSPVLRSWFGPFFATPTTAQAAAWPILLRGENLLLTAPTGQGKTLAAFLPVFEQLLHPDEENRLRCLYVAPLRALCNDVAERLETHLVSIRETASDTPELTVGVWTGDTTSAQRRRLRQHPPHIAVTTPESLALWLTHPEGCAALADVRTVIVDEVHSLAGTKRGADLSITLERMTALASHEVSRIGLSATCSPLEEVGRWLGGVGRTVKSIAILDRQPWELSIEHIPQDESFLAAVLERLPNLLMPARTTLIFVNTRWLAERLTWLLRRRCPQWTDQIEVHHGSLAASIRRDGEQGLKQGKLRAVVTSTSLELGVDIGPIDQVILVHPPGGAARLLQRLGRSGHEPTGQRRGVLFVDSLTEAAEAAITRAAGQLTQLEPLTIPSCPLDVLCQQLIGMGVQEGFTPAAAWSLVRKAYPFRELSLKDFIECLAYVTGKRPHVAVPARLRRQDQTFTAADKTTVRIYRQNLGVIVPEPMRKVQHTDGQAIGQVNDSFADRLQPGDRFLLQGRSWEVKRLRLSEVEVAEANGLPAMTRWEGGAWHLPQALAERLWWFRVALKEKLLEGASTAQRWLQDEYGLNAVLARELAAWHDEQETVSEIPSTQWLIETATLPVSDMTFHALHTPLGPAAVAGLAQLLAWRLRHHGRVGTVTGLLGCGIVTPRCQDWSEEDWRELLAPTQAEADFDIIAADTPALGERFRGTAYTGMMLLKQPLGPRRRVGGRNWAGDKLLHWLRAVDPEFPLLTQALREVRQEVFAVPDLIRCLRQFHDKPIRLRQLTEPSPFTAAWLPTDAMTLAAASPLEEALRAVAQERRSVHVAGA